MTVHYHGTPITPHAQLIEMAGCHFCIPFPRPESLGICLRQGQSLMFDNGAFSIWKAEGEAKTDWSDYYAWLDPILAHPHWAVVPDIIDGYLEQNAALVNEWPYQKDKSGVVWHMNEPLGWLEGLIDRGFAKVCIGSTKEFEPGSDAWSRKLDTVFNTLAQRGPLPWLHMLRGLGQIGPEGYPFASADSTNVAQNYKRNGQTAANMARFLDGFQAPVRWHKVHEQDDFWPATTIRPIPRKPAGKEHFLAADYEPSSEADPAP